jgi:predicted nucleic acid-binding protein
VRAFIDTNVFIYAAGAPHPYKEPCREILRKVGAGSLDGTTNAEVLQELLYVLGRRTERKIARSVVENVIKLIPDLLSIGAPELELAAQLLEKHETLSARDVVHIASMRLHGIRNVVSFDRHFDGVDGIRRLEPGVDV